jgi:Arylsulfatase A and related enzymes
MPPAKNKTVETTASVVDFLDTLADDAKRKDSLRLAEIIKAETGFEPRMWGTSIIGFGSYHYHYDSGREGDAPLVGFSPRKNEFALYLAQDFEEREELLRQFGKHKTGKACIYVKKLADINEGILKRMIAASVNSTRKKYPV